MNGLLKYVLLPKEATEVELRHVRRINRIALGACLAHIPLFIFVAWLCNTSIAQAIGFGALLVAGPAVATFTLSNPRQLSLVFGFTSMALGALLVHLGQGPMQIEMHFHFFAALALLTVWGNPLIIWVATITVAVHHGLFWFLLPHSVFNYDAPFVVVLVHAAFVVVEAIAASFIARNFFDNVIGLEKIVQAKTEEVRRRNSEMALILANAEEGFLTVNLDGTMDDERSAIVAQWFGPAPERARFWDYVGGGAASLSTMLKLGWEQLVEGIFPFDLAAEQMPKTVSRDDRHLSVKYKAVNDAAGNLFKVLVMVTDVTPVVEAAKREMQQKELVAAFQRFSSDRNGFQQFFDDAKTIVRRIHERCEPSSRELDFRDVHTLKGNSSQFGVLSVANFCHKIESDLVDGHRALTLDERRQLQGVWDVAAGGLKLFVSESATKQLSVDLAEYRKLLEQLRELGVARPVVERVAAWSKEPTTLPFNRLAQQAKSLAERLGKGRIEVQIEDHGVRLHGDQFRNIWMNATHLVRNAVDHAFDDAVGAEASPGKTPRITFSSLETDQSIVLKFADNGRGIDWQKLAAAATDKGLPCKTEDDLRAALFTDGVSTKDSVTDVSGRGVGMAALKWAVEAMGGTIVVASTPGAGTTFTLTFPKIAAKGTALAA